MNAHYLTKATLAPATRSIGALLAKTADADSGHRLLWTLFYRTDNKETARDFIYRQVDDRSFLIVSQRQPADVHALWHLGPKPYEPDLTAGERYSFILRANPAMAVTTGQRGKSLRVDAVMHAKSVARETGAAWGPEQEEQAALAWLFQREDVIGVSFDRNASVASKYRQNIIPRQGKRPIRFSSVDYEGLLTVTNAEHFKTTLYNGIGKARAFGCGLMLIRRAPA